MIGVKGIAKKPITDATATPEHVLAQDVFYNNTGQQIGTLSKSSIESTLKFTIRKGNYSDVVNLVTAEYRNKFKLIDGYGLYVKTKFDSYGTNDIDNTIRATIYVFGGKVISEAYDYILKCLYVDLTQYNISEILGIRWINSKANSQREFRSTFGFQTAILDTTIDLDGIDSTADHGSTYSDNGPRVVVTKTALIAGVTIDRTSTKIDHACFNNDVNFEIIYR